MRTLGSAESPVLIIGAFVALRIAWGLCCAWLERSRRKTTLAVLDKLLAWERERRKEEEPSRVPPAPPP
jgi:hypothetical protein